MSVIEEHLNIQNVEDLANYIDKMSGGYPFGVFKMDNHSISGFFNFSEFRLDYDHGKSMMLILNGVDEDYDRLKNIISPVMWYKDATARKDIMGPMLSYTSVTGTKVLCWNYIDPERMLSEVLAKSIKAGDDLSGLEVYLPGFDLDAFEKNLMYGKNTSYFADNELKRIDIMSEFELYIAIKALMKARHELEKIRKKENVPELDEEINAVKYKVAYLIQKLAQFGVKVPEPSKNFDGYTIDVVAWLKWWDGAFNDIIRKYPDIVPFRTDTHGLKPDGNYKDYIQIIKNNGKGEPE